MMAQITVTTDDLPSINTMQTTSLIVNPPIEIGSASAVGQNWDYSFLSIGELTQVSFEGTEGMDGEADFPNATFTRTGDLVDLLGVDVPDLPIDLPNSVAYYSLDEVSGAVLLEGINVNLTVPGFLELGPRSLTPEDQPYPFWIAASMGESYAAASDFVLDIPASAIPIPGIDGFIEFIRLRIGFDSNTNIDAHGNMTLPNGDYQVLRYNELITTSIKLSPFVDLGTGNPIELDVSILPDEIWEQLGGDFSDVFVDTSFTVNLYRFLTNEENYPVATLNYVENDTIAAVTSIEFLAETIPPEASFIYETLVNNCYVFLFENTSQGTVGSYLWEFGDGETNTSTNPSHQYEEAGEYTVILNFTDIAGAYNADTQIIVVDCMPLAADFTYNILDCSTVEFQNLTESYTTELQWDLGNGETSNEEGVFSVEYDVPVGTAEDFEVTLTAINIGIDTSVTTQTVSINCPGVGLNDLEKNQFNLYPNPVDQKLNIVWQHGLNEPSKVEIYDLMGRLIERQKVDRNQSHLVLSTDLLDSGIYLIKVLDEQERLLVVEKIFKE